MNGLLEEPLIHAEDEDPGESTPPQPNPGNPPPQVPDPPPTKLPNDTDAPEGQGFDKLRKAAAGQLSACVEAIRERNAQYRPMFLPKVDIRDWDET